MNKQDIRIFTILINSKIKDSRRIVDEFKGDNLKDYMLYIGNNIDEIYHQFEAYNYSDYRSKTEAYCNNIEFILEYYPEVTYPAKKAHRNTSRSIYYKMLKELIDIYIYNPSVENLQKLLFKRAADTVDNRANKRQKTTF